MGSRTSRMNWTGSETSWPVGGGRKDRVMGASEAACGAEKRRRPFYGRPTNPPRAAGACYISVPELPYPHSRAPRRRTRMARDGRTATGLSFGPYDVLAKVG